MSSFEENKEEVKRVIEPYLLMCKVQLEQSEKYRLSCQIVTRINRYVWLQYSYNPEAWERVRESKQMEPLYMINNFEYFHSIMNSYDTRCMYFKAVKMDRLIQDEIVGFFITEQPIAPTLVQHTKLKRPKCDNFPRSCTNNKRIRIAR
jgi:hypothetical protein